jgi:hypothetical protein
MYEWIQERLTPHPYSSYEDQPACGTPQSVSIPRTYIHCTLTGQRVLDVEEEGLPKIEYSFSANGRMKEVDITHMATYWSIPRGNGILYGEGQG